MTVDSFELMLCDMYEMDLYIPESSFYKTDFKNASYTLWAIYELDLYVCKKIGPSEVAPVETFIKWVDEFLNLVKSFPDNIPYTALMFSIAIDLAMDVRDILIAMK